MPKCPDCGGRMKPHCDSPSCDWAFCKRCQVETRIRDGKTVRTGLKKET